MSDGPQPVHRVDILPTRLGTVRSIIEIVAIIAAGLWGFYVFIYQERLKPLAERPSYQLETSFERDGSSHGVDFLKVNVVLRNTSKVDIDSAAEALDVTAYRVLKPESNVHTRTGSEETIDRSATFSRPTVVFADLTLREGAIGGQRGSHAFLAPGESVRFSYPFTLPRGRYDVIDVLTQEYANRYPIRPPRAIGVRRDSGMLQIDDSTIGITSTLDRFHL